MRIFSLSSKKILLFAAVVGFPWPLAAQNEIQEVREGFAVSDDGTKLFWRSLGSGEETVIIPLAAWLTEAMRPLAADRRIVLYDMRNRGASDEGRFGLDYEVRDLDAVRRAVGAGRISLVAHSYTGAIAALYARDFPHRVKRVALVSPIGPIGKTFRGGAAEPANYPGAVEHLRNMREADVDKTDPRKYCRVYVRLAVILPMVQDSASIERMADDPCLYEQEWPGRWNTYVWELVETFGDWNWVESFRGLSIPFLILHGDADPAAPFAGSIEWAGTLPEARLIRLENVGHAPWLEAPDVFYPAINEFLDGRWPSAAFGVRN